MKPRRDPRLTPDRARGSLASLRGSSQNATEPATSVWSASGAAIAGWALLAVVNALAIATQPLPKAGWSTRAWHHLYDAGHLLALGALAAAATLLWHNFGPRSRWLGLLAVAAASLALGVVVLPDDLLDFSRRLPGPTQLALPVVVAAVSLLVPAAWLATRMVTSRKVRLGVIAGAAALQVGNNFVAARDYEGGHLVFAFLAATSVGAALAGLPLPRRIAAQSRLRRRAAVLSAMVLGVWCMATPTPQRVLGDMLELGGAVLAPYIGRLRELVGADAVPAAPIPAELAEWFTGREDHPPIAPSEHRFGDPDSVIVIFLTIDSMRWEMLNDATYRDSMPVLWQLADEGVVFEEARSPGSSTLTTMSSVFSGKHRAQLLWTNTPGLGWSLLYDHTKQFPEILHEAGVHTEQTVAWGILRGEKKVIRGFAAERFIKAPSGQRFALASEMLAPLQARLRKVGTGPAFLHAHLMDAHAPYDATDEEGSAFQRQIAELGLIDAAIGKLLDTAREEDLLDRVILFVAADHGEAFGQHGIEQHSNVTYDELVHVPFFIWADGLRPERTSTPVSLMDIGPTILDIYELPTPGHFMGESLLPVVTGDDRRLTRPIAGTARVGGSRPVYYLWLPDRTKVIWNLRQGLREIYDLSTDPYEENNIFEDLGDEGIRKMGLLHAFFAAQPYFDALNEPGGSRQSAPPGAEPNPAVWPVARAKRGRRSRGKRPRAEAKAEKGEKP